MLSGAQTLKDSIKHHRKNASELPAVADNPPTRDGELAETASGEKASQDTQCSHDPYEAAGVKSTSCARIL
eukprot:11868803-Alexandrium_andersonii.AAC.1